jgi:ArsR family transcriptional regulator
MSEAEECPANAKKVCEIMFAHKEAKKASDRMKLLAHPTRLQILKILSEEDQCVCIFASALGKRQPNISQHLGKLKENCIIDSYMNGKYAYYTLKDQNVKKLLKSLGA